jgi:uncharacterized membrane protein YqgA involved in biofilm formation
VLGTVVNAVAIIAGAAMGMLFRRAVPARIREAIVQGIGLAVLTLGLRTALGSPGEPLATILALGGGAAIGRLMDLDGRLTRWERRVEQQTGGGSLIRAFITATLLFSAGAMAVLGAIEGGLEARHDILLAKSVIDGVVAVVLAASLGPGVILSAVPVFLYQGGIVLLARSLAPLLLGPPLAALTQVGGTLIMVIGLTMLDVGRLRAVDFLPALILAPFLGAWL